MRYVYMGAGGGERGVSSGRLGMSVGYFMFFQSSERLENFVWDNSCKFFAGPGRKKETEILRQVHPVVPTV